MCVFGFFLNIIFNKSYFMAHNPIIWAIKKLLTWWYPCILPSGRSMPRGCQKHVITSAQAVQGRRIFHVSIWDWSTRREAQTFARVWASAVLGRRRRSMCNSGARISRICRKKKISSSSCSISDRKLCHKFGVELMQQGNWREVCTV